MMRLRRLCFPGHAHHVHLDADARGDILVRRLAHELRRLFEQLDCLCVLTSLAKEHCQTSERVKILWIGGQGLLVEIGGLGHSSLLLRLLCLAHERCG